MRLVVTALVLGACTQNPPPTKPVRVQPRQIPVGDLIVDERVQVWPGVELVPENGLEFRVDTGTPQSLLGVDIRVFQVNGDVATEVTDAIPRVTWNGPRHVAKFTVSGLRRGAPHRLVFEGLVAPDGTPYPRLSHGFRVISRDTSPPSGKRLSVRGNPAEGTREPLVLAFAEPVREDAVHHLATLVGGRPEPSVWTLDESQTIATFLPEQAWGAEPVSVSVGAGIRDLAGNAMVDVPPGFLTPLVPHEAAP